MTGGTPRGSSRPVKALVHSLAVLALGASANEVPNCAIGDSQCLESMPVLDCAFGDAASVERCQDSMALLAQKSDAGWRDATGMLALAYLARSDLTGTSEAAARLDRDRSIALYRGLIASDPNDAESVFGLAGAVEDKSERIRLLRQYDALSPDTVFGRRFLARALYDEGAVSSAAKLEAGRLMEEAYNLQSGAHRWWLAGNAIYYYEQAGKPELATLLKARISRELDVEDLTSESLASDESQAGRVRSSACNSLLVRAVGPDRCFLNLDRIESFLASGARDESAQRIADDAAGAMEALARGDSVLCPALLERLDRFVARGFDSPAIRGAREWVQQLEGSITIE